ncbi:hypothetical protein V6R21_16320 [Limibacter armeniacum]|uniref:hypothetical protein n=1 Tax=Limibacter armeniacum TaxID=466084 RepID=UPI002FE58633
MKKIIFFLSVWVLFAIQTGSAQSNLILVHTLTQDTVEISKGDLVAFNYDGYLGQDETVSGKVLKIDGQMVILNSPKHKKNTFSGKRYLNVKDITGFRKFRKSRQWLKPALKLSATIGNVLLSNYWSRTDKLSTTNSILAGMGIGLGSNIGINLLFSEKIKYKVEKDGWKILIKEPVLKKVL